jgi:hypothetical protein
VRYRPKHDVKSALVFSEALSYVRKIKYEVLGRFKLNNFIIDGLSFVLGSSENSIFFLKARIAGTLEGSAFQSKNLES